jgi:glycosyltransferase involved in cell wall biosynthesis
VPETCTLVIPCFDEAQRLKRSEFLRLALLQPALQLLFVDDGSTDGTPDVLRSLREANPRQVSVERLDRNVGKAEAVRHGLRAALQCHTRFVGYTDADLSTPVDEISRMIAAISASPTHVLLASRVRLLGTRIERRAVRHYLGRVFATAASAALRIPVYDTQCGAKLFLTSEALAAALEEPFRSRWAFDVEILARLLSGRAGCRPLAPDDMREFPLRVWRDVAGSKLGARAMIRAGVDLLTIWAQGAVQPRGRQAVRSLAPPIRTQSWRPAAKKRAPAHGVQR